MKSNKLIFVLVLIGALAFNFFFWQEKMGLNVLLFDLFVIASMFWIHPNIKQKKTVLLTAGGTLLAALFIVFNNSLFSKIVHLLSMVSFVGFAHARNLSFIGDAFSIGLTSIAEAPVKLMNIGKDSSLEKPQISGMRKWIKLSVIPTAIVLVFYSIYAQANPQFASISSSFWTGASEFIFSKIKFARILFFFLGFLLMAGLLWRTMYFKNFEKPVIEDSLTRNRFLPQKRLIPFKVNGLKQEYQTALLVIISLNVLLFLVNLVDFYYVWMAAAKVTPNQLSGYVHEATYLLIVAIILAMVIIIYFFRKNLNFYPGNSVLKVAAYAWVFQNAILAISVAIRNYRYIDHFGLAYKRLGVFIFLLMVFIGLITLFFKIKEKRTLYYLLHRNSWALYSVLIILSVINWDVMITRYNISVDTKSTIDVPYLVYDLSDKNIYILKEHEALLRRMTTSTRGFDKMLEDKIWQFEKRQEKYSWLSWNWADERNK